MEVKEGPCLCGEPEKMGVDENGKPVLIRCPLYQRLYVNTPEGKKEEWKCAIAWLPTLVIENTDQVKAVASYIESFRNETIARVDRATRLTRQKFQPDALVHEASELIEVQDADPE